MTKKISLLLAIILAFCSCVALSSCGEPPEDPNGYDIESYVFDFHISDDGTYYIVTGYGINTETETIIPDEHEGKPVKAIKEEAFGRDPQKVRIEVMTISKNIETIGASSFYECTNLRTLNFNKGLKSIGHGAFAKCSALTQVILPEGLESIDDLAFRECTNLESVALPSTLKHLGANVFAGTKFLNENARIHNRNIAYCNNSDIKAWVLYANFDIVDANLPDNTVGIASDAFAYCDALTTLEIPASVKYISADAFIGCTALTTINYGGSPDDFANIVIESGNDALFNAIINFAK